MWTRMGSVVQKKLKAFIGDDCREVTLTNNIKQHMKPNTNIGSDGWRGYYILVKCSIIMVL